jgi:hypothetical protein
MSNVDIVELRAICGKKLNHLFVWYRSTDGQPIMGLDGWHYKATTQPTLDALTHGVSTGDAMLWPQQAPPEPNDRAAYDALE